MMHSLKKVNFIINLLLIIIIIIILLNVCDSSKLQPQQQHQQQQHQQQSNSQPHQQQQQQQHQQHNFDEINKNKNNDNPIKYEAPDDCHYEILDLNSISLICSLRTINSVYDTTNFSVIQNDNTVSLRIYCNDSIFIQSSLEPKSFIHLNRLRELSIDYCKIKFLSHSVLFGLMDLRNLTLRTENNRWPSFNLDIESNAFVHAKNLERLDLSYNNIWQLPENLFCPLTNLNMLNLSVNHLQDINELSFRELLKIKQDIKNQQNQTQLLPTYSTIFASIGSTGSIGAGAGVGPTPVLPSSLSSVGTAATKATTTTIAGGSAIPTISNINGLPSTSSSSSIYTPLSQMTALKNACLLDIEILDLSYNYFLLLPSYGFGLLKRLRQLRLHQNEISMLDDKALYNLKQLQILDLSSNKLVALPAELFTDTRESIQEIHLQNNSISVLSPILFSNLQQLQVLDISSNHITSTWFTNTTFAGLIRLVLLNLSFNRITTVQPEIFSDLYTLQILNLRFNQIETITSDTFASMNNLHTLLLSNNKIKYLNAYSLNGLYGLSLLALDTNLIFGIHAEAFRNCSALQELNLSGNKLTEVPVAIKAMQRLRTIDLGENQIEQLMDPNQFSGMLKLYGLRLISNRIRNITSNIFKHLESLQILNLAHNQIDRIESGAFEQTAKIQAIRLDGNRLQSMDGLFSKMKELLWLNVSDNHLDTFDLSQIPPQLQWLDIHKNSIQEMTNYFALENHMQLQTLDASFNKIQLITPNIIPNSIELLFLNDNYIRTIESHTFMNKTNLTRVDLYANYVETLDPKALRLRPNKMKRQLPEFYIGGNPFICDCNIDWLQKINLVSTRQYPKIMDLETIYCKLLNNRDRSYITLIDADPVNFLCAYKTHCFALCHCCEFDACDCEMTCPQNCTCYHDGLWKTNVVECSNAGYTDMPGNIPMDATELYIDGNNLRLNIHGFIGRKNLKVIFANNSAINEIYNQTFIGLRKLKILHLEDNQLSTFQGYEFQSMENLRELYLQNNRLYFINNLTFIDLKKLEVVRLDNNKLMHFEIWQLSMNPYLVEIGIANNLWSCECEFLHQFRNYLQINQQKILDSTSISCIYNNLTNILKQDKNGIKCTAYKDLGLMSGSGNNNNNNNGMSGGRGSTSGNYGRGISDLSYGGGGGGGGVDGDDQRYYGQHNILNGNNVGLTTYVRPQDMDNLLPLLLIATCGFVGVLAIMLMTFCYRRELKLWAHTHCLPVICYRSSGSSSASQFIDEYDKDRLFDAYITYSLQDEHFINQILVNTLENDVGYRLCLHYRDFNVNTYVADTIIEAVESSKRAIIVLSRNFLYNEWSRFEFKSAIHEVIKRRRKFIFLLYGDLPQRDIDADMRLYLKTNTCIEWDDKKFWQKLRLALPHLRTASTIVPVPRPLGGTVRSSTAMHFLSNNKRLIGPTQGPPINSNSAVNIYATAQYQTGGPTAGNIPGTTLRRSNIDGISTGSSLVRHPNNNNNNNNNNNIIVDCTNNYATINDCLNNCSDKYDTININKFTLTNEKCRGPAPPPPPPPPPPAPPQSSNALHSSNNFNNNNNNNMNNSNYQLSKTLDRYQHHEYAEPTNCIKETFPNYNNLNNLNNKRSICTTNTITATTTTTTDLSSSRIKCNTMGGHTHTGHYHGPLPPPSAAATSHYNYNNNNNNSSNINNINNHHVLNNNNLLSSCSSVDNDSNYSVDSADVCDDGLDGACSSSNNGGSNKCYSYRNINNCSNTSSNCAAMITDGGLVSNGSHGHGIITNNINNINNNTNNINNLNNLNNNNIDDTPQDSDDNYECDVDFNQRNCKLNCTTISGSGNINNNNNNNNNSISNAAINNSNIINNNTIHNSISNHNNNNNNNTTTTNSDVNCIDRRLPQAMWA